MRLRQHGIWEPVLRCALVSVCYRTTAAMALGDCLVARSNRVKTLRYVRAGRWLRKRVCAAYLAGDQIAPAVARITRQASVL